MSQAESLTEEWLTELYSLPNEKQPQKTISLLDRYRGIFRTAPNEKEVPKSKQMVLDNEISQINAKLDQWIKSSLPPDRLSKTSHATAFNSHNSTSKLSSNSSTSPTSSSSSSIGSHTNNSCSDGKQVSNSRNQSGRKGDPMTSSVSSIASSSTATSKNSETQKQLEKMKSLDLDQDETQCTYCGIAFSDRMELMAHCQTESHQNVIMSDEGKIFISLKARFSVVLIVELYRIDCPR